jgi:hypothetical protein
MLAGIDFKHPFRALSAVLAAKFNILPGRWQHFGPATIVPAQR